MLSILLACIAMTARDALGTGLTVAEAHSRPVMAGTFDALGDIAAIAVTVMGAGPVLAHGITTYSVSLLGAMTATSFVGTVGYTTLANRLMPTVPLSDTIH